MLGAVMGALLFVAAPWLIRASGAVDALVDPAVTYLRIRAVGTPLLLLGYVGHGAFRGASNTRTPLGIVVIANVVNAALTLGLVFGAGLGIAGAAWATVAAEAVAVAVFAWRLGRTGLPLAGHGRPGRAQLAALVAVSRDLFVRTGSLLAGLLAVTVAASRLDAQIAAAHQVLYQTFLMVSFLMDGLAIAGQAMIGTALGAGDEDEARAVGHALVRWGLIGGAALAAILIAGAGVLPRVLTDDAAVLAIVGTAWWFAALGHVVNGPVFALDGVLMGAEDVAFLRTWTAVAAVTGGVGAFVAAAAGGGLLGLWVAMEAMMLVRLLSLWLRVRGSAWSRTGLGLVPGT